MSLTLWRRECACGAAVVADPLDPFPGVQRHIKADPHRSWSLATSWAPPPLEPIPTAAPVLVDVSGNTAVRPVRSRRRGHRLIPGRRVA